MLSNVSPSMVTVGVAAATLGAVVIVAGWMRWRFWFTRRPACGGGKRPGEVRPPIQEVIKNLDDVEYDLGVMHVPKVTGRKLRFLAWLCYTRFGQIILGPRMKRNSNLDGMGGIYLPEKPTYYATPPTPPLTEDQTRPNKEVLQKLLEKEVDCEQGGFHLPTVADFVGAFRSGRCSPTEVAEAVLNAIEDSNKASPPLRAIIDTSRDVVLAQANASTQRWKEGKTLSLLDGVPVAIKGEFRVEPYEFYGGASFIPQLGRGVPEAALVEKLASAGAVIIGVANLQEFGAGTLGSNPNKNHLTARNPYNPQCYPGGSSSGSAVCVAAGLCPIALGTDGGGSIRIPAATCGVVGLKPTNRFMDSRGILPLAYTVSGVGPLCASILDAAIAMDILSKETEGEKKLLPLEGVGKTKLEGVRVGIYWKFFEHANPEIVEKCKLAVVQLKSLGVTVVDITIPELDDCRVAHAISIMAEFVNALAKDIDTHFSEIIPESHIVLSSGYTVSAMEYINAQKQRTRAIEVMKYFFDELNIDAILTPATAIPAPSISPADISHGVIDSIKSTELMRFSFLGNLTGLPGLVLPVGYTSGGLPVGLQVMGQWYKEGMLLKIGYALEKTGMFPARKPQVFYDLIKTAAELAPVQKIPPNLCDSSASKKHPRSRQLLSVETFRSHAAEDVLKAALEQLGWKNVTAASSSACKSKCDIYWRGLERDEPPIPDSSYIARIPGMSTCSHKDELSRHINRLRQFFPDDFSFYPRTWLLPEDQESFEAYAHSAKGKKKKKTYIVKPDEGAQGGGIFLIQHPRDLAHLKQPSIVQEYISKPLLLRGLKFDLRLYVLIASLDPVQVYLSDSGMARFCTVPYKAPSVSNMHETFMHLTNYSLNKRSKEFVFSEHIDDGSKRTLESVLKELESQGCDVKEMWEGVGELVCKTVLALLPQLMVEGRSYMSEHSLKTPINGFQLLGIDVLIDRKLRPHLLEVNAHPSLRVDFEQPVRPGVVEYIPSPVDMVIKLPAVRDSLKIVAAKLKGRECDVEGSCFSELFPSKLDQYSHLRVFERCALLYSHSLGVKRGTKMGSSAFRSFTRQCKLCAGNFTTADVDILYINVCRRYGNTYERNALSFNGFCEALLIIARKIGAAQAEPTTSLSALEFLLTKCERETVKR